MKKKTIRIILLALLLIVAGAVFAFFHISKNLRTMRQDAAKQWSRLEEVYQNRTELISGPLNSVTEAERDSLKILRKPASRPVSENDLDEQHTSAFMKAQEDYTRYALSVLLQSDSTAYVHLQQALLRTNQHIQKMLDGFYKKAGAFERYRNRFPNNIVSAFTGMKEIEDLNK